MLPECTKPVTAIYKPARTGRRLDPVSALPQPGLSGLRTGATAPTVDGAETY
jgi:hypothetical protein